MNKSSGKKEKHKRKNNKGFTLVELLVTISILGLITVMSLPIIRNIIEANTLKKYATYKDSVETSAKLYVDSYSDDLFGKKLSGCAYITYDQMNEKKLIKDIQENGISCNSDKTYVRVVKLNDKYTYTAQIGCGNSSSNEKIASSKVNILYPRQGVPRNETCLYDAKTKLSVKVSPYESYEKTDKKRYALKIILESVTGINNGVQVSYAWHKEETDSSKDIWQDATFRNISSSKQEEQILNTKTITLKSSEILTPDEETGSYKLLVKINNAMDITGTNLITDLNKIVTFGPYKIDNQPPVIKSLSVSSANQSYNTFKAKININATDNNMLSSQNDVKVCIKTNTSSCSSNDYKKYASSYDITIPGEKYDGSKERVYVYVKDNAGNVKKDSADYTIYKECSVVVKDKNNVIKEGTCSKKCGSNGTKMDTVGTKDKHTGAKCSETMKNVAECNRFDCCKEVRYEDGDTCSSSANTFCGTSTKNQLAYSKYDSSVRCSAYDKSSGGSSCSLGTCKPSKPTITNPTNGNWTNKDFSLTVKTTTTSNLGYWYYSYDKKNWVIYNKENYNSYGKKEFITSPFSAERNQPVYIRVCNIKASTATDSTNCSDYASTNIRIDKTPPPSPKYNGLDILNNTFYTTSNDCSGKGGHNYDESCTINVTTKGWHFYFETNTNVVDNNNGSGIKKTQYIWNHNGPAVKCPNWTDDCSPWEINKNGNRGNYLRDCERGIDNAGNVGYSLCMDFYIKWPS